MWSNYNIIMDEMQFEWDENKNEINKKKHGVSFEEAKTVFYDADAILIDDPDHSIEEERFLLLGLSRKTKLLIVCHCMRNEEETIRLISARRATTNEARQYCNMKG